MEMEVQRKPETETVHIESKSLPGSHSACDWGLSEFTMTSMATYSALHGPVWRGLLFTLSDNNFGILKEMIETTKQLLASVREVQQQFPWKLKLTLAC